LHLTPATRREHKFQDVAFSRFSSQEDLEQAIEALFAERQASQ
jgi:hypothetical protein